MDPILRRSSLFYATSLMTYMALMGRFTLTRDWTAFEVIPLFIPVWIVSGMLASEHDECYAFLRLLPVPDRVVVRTKFALILSTVAVAWALITLIALFRMGDGIASASTLVYVTLISAAALLLVPCYQIAIWRFGVSTMIPVIVVSIVAGMLLCLVHVANLKYHDGWPAFSRMAIVEWLAGAPWISIAVIVALALTAYRALMEAGVRVKAASEEHL
jgi:hypothetical protein